MVHLEEPYFPTLGDTQFFSLGRRVRGRGDPTSPVARP